MVKRYSLEQLNETVAGLGQLKQDYENAEQNADGVHEALGYADLRDAVSEFSENWRKNRERQLELIEKGHTALSEIVVGLEDYDGQGVDELNKEPEQC